mmetsp:Transcript_24308/g.63809  ORF Transcript_24308/g.63809 Transcript_24308/m.63809 type:complete len:312 (-) Transcript_24308:333-1268(-)
MPEPGAELRVPKSRTVVGLPLEQDVYADWGGTEFGEEIHFVSTYKCDSGEDSAEASTWIGSSCSPYQCESTWSPSSRRHERLCNPMAGESDRCESPGPDLYSARIPVLSGGISSAYRAKDECFFDRRSENWSPRHSFRASRHRKPPQFIVPLRRWRAGDRGPICQERPLPLLIRAPQATIRVHSGKPFAVAGPTPLLGISGSAMGDSDQMHSAGPPLFGSLERHPTEEDVVPFDVMFKDDSPDSGNHGTVCGHASKAGMVESRSTASSGSEFDIDEVDIDEELSEAYESSSDGEVQLEDSVDFVDDFGYAD